MKKTAEISSNRSFTILVERIEAEAERDLYRAYVEGEIDDGEEMVPVMSHAELEEVIANYEKRYGMSSEEFLSKPREDTFDFNDWRMLLEISNEHDPYWITDDCGSYWPAICERCHERTMQVVRPGEAECANCGGRTE
jgi:hypothetical protein